MACVIKRNKYGVINEVYLPDGKTLSKAYYAILDNIQEGIPSPYSAIAIESLQPYVGKYINNLDEPEEIALGLYLELYSSNFQKWYGQWVAEPTVTSDLMVEKDGVKKSIFEVNQNKLPFNEQLKSARTKTVKGLKKAVDLSIKKLQERIRLTVDARERAKLNPKYTNEIKTERELYFNNLIRSMSDNIKTLTKKNDVAYVIAQGVTDMDVITSLLAGPTVSLTELQLADDLAKTWDKVFSILGIDSIDDIIDAGQKKQVQDILDKVDRATRSISTLTRKQLVDKINEVAPEGRKITEKEILAMKDVSWLKSVSRDISTVDNKLIGYLAVLLNNVNLRIEKEHQRNYKTIEDEFAKISDNPEIKQNGFDIFIKEQENQIGDKTLGLIGRYSQEYYDASRQRYKNLRANLEKAKDDPDQVKAIWKDHNDWLAENTMLFNVAPFIDTKAYTDADRMKVIDKFAAEGFTKEEINDLIVEAKKQYKRFESDAKQQEIILDAQILHGTIVLEEGVDQDQYIQEQVAEWRRINDPVAYNEFVTGDRPGINQAFKGSKYSIKAPRKIIAGVDSKYYDANFAKIAADPALYNFYLFFRDFIKEQLSYLPEEEIDSLQSNFLPIITDRVAKEYGLTGLKESMNGIGDWFLKQMTVIDYESRGKKDPVTGKERFGFKPRFLEGNQDISERSKDLVLMAKLFSDMALIYKHKIQVQDTVDSINDTVQQLSTSSTLDKFGNEINKDEAPKNLQNMTKSAILGNFYQVAPDQQGLGKKRFYTASELLTGGLVKSEKGKQAKVIEEQIQTLTEELENPLLNDKERSAKEEKLYKLKRSFYELGGRSFGLTTLVDALNRLTREKGIALNPFSAARNLLIGGINNQIHAVGGEDFTRADLRKANSIIKASAARYVTWGAANSVDAQKILKILLDTKTIDGEDGIFGQSIKGIDKTTVIQKIKNHIPSPFSLMRSTDYMFKSQTAISMLVSTKVKTEQGEFNLYEVLDENLNYNEEKYGKWSTENNNGKDFEDFYDNTISKVGQVAKKLHGFFGGGQTLLGKDTAWGRMLFVFRSWLPETVATRFEEKRWDPILERNTEGYYRTFFSQFANEEGLRIKDAVKDIWSAISKGEVENMPKEQVANIRKMIAELSAIMILAMTYLILKSGADDDDDNKTARLLLNQFSLLNRDLTYYINPYSAGELTKNAVPMVTTLTQTADALTAMGYYFAGVEKDDTGELQYDGERTLLKISKSLPYVNNVNRVIYYSGRIGDVR